MRTNLSLSRGILLCLWIVAVKASSQSKTQVDRLIGNICNRLYDEATDSDENQQWAQLCGKWVKSMEHHQQREHIMDETDMSEAFQLRKGGSRGGGRGGGSRGGGSRSGGFRSSGSRFSGGSRISSITRYRSSRSGASISRPTGHLWSRTRHTFLPISTGYHHRSRSSNNRYTTSSTSSITYYYCTSSTNATMEIQCSSVDGDNQCCEDETFRQPFCCGGKVADDLIEDFNQATRRLAQVFYTLAALALFLHVLKRQFYR